MEKRLVRAEVPVDMTWNLDDLFDSQQSWELALQKVENDVDTVSKFKGRLGEGATTLLECLSAQEQLHIQMMAVDTYAYLRFSEDGTNPLNQANSSRAGAMRAKVLAGISFIYSEILELPEGTIERYLRAEPGLESLRKRLFEILDGLPHKLSAETEAALASLGEVLGSPYQVYQRSKLSDMVFDPITLEDGSQKPNSFALFEDHYELSRDTIERRMAAESFANTLHKYKNTFATTFATEVNKHVTMARLRKYESAQHMLLEPHQITFEMYNNQLDILQNELAPHMRRFAKLKQRVLGLDEMFHCDLKAPLDPEFNPKTTIEAASEVILESLDILGDEYGEIMRRGLRDRWIDFADNVGKSTGAFCSSPYASHPYILITWTDTMRGAFVLAHELGHAGHFALANRYQRALNVRPSAYFIEAPSTMNELLLGQHILKKSTDPRMRRWVITQFLGTYYHNFVTHLLEGALQRRIFNLAEKGTPITASTLSEQKGEVLENFWGDSVKITDGARLTWMRQPHYYMGLYPYTYSAGLTASTAVAQLIQEEGKPAAERWLSVLKAGGTMRPLELMKIAGVDMSTPDPIRKAVSYVGSLVDELEKSFEM